MHMHIHFVVIYVSVQYELSLYCRELQLRLMQILRTRWRNKLGPLVFRNGIMKM